MKEPGCCLWRRHSFQSICFLGNLTFRSKTQLLPAGQQLRWWMVHKSGCLFKMCSWLTLGAQPISSCLGSSVSVSKDMPSPPGDSDNTWIKTFPGFSVCHQFKEIPNMKSPSLQNRYIRHQEDLLCLSDSPKSCFQQRISLQHLNSDSFYTWSSVPMKQEETCYTEGGDPVVLL